MLNQVAAAFDRQDYRTAAQLLQELLKQSPQDPWVQLYWGRLQEVSSKLEEADAIYRNLLRHTSNPKLAVQARQGIQRIAMMQEARRQQAIAQATADPQASAPGFLILKAVTGMDRTAAIQNLARVMQVDAYTARLLLPSRGWRLYRSGPIGELTLYGQALQAAGVPAFWAALPELEKIQVFRINYFQTLAPKATVICQNSQDQLGQLTFDWSEVSQRVEGMLPIFEQVVELGYRDRLERKEKTQDYSHLCDLHLPGRRCILRLHDSHYTFEQGLSVSQSPSKGATNPSTLRTNWNHLTELIAQHSPRASVLSEFTAFAETAADFAVPLSRLQPHIYILRQSETFWDPAFQLYSGLAFLEGAVQF